MKNSTFFLKLIVVFLLLLVIACNIKQDILTIDDKAGNLGSSNSPVSLEAKLSRSDYEAVIENRLALKEITDNSNSPLIPLQIKESNKETGLHKLVLNVPEGEKGKRKFKLVENELPFNQLIIKKRDDDQFIISENEKKVLQYNYQTVFEKDVIRANKEKIEEYTRDERDTFTVTSIYAVPRSNYIHPLYGLEGEILTRDWPDGGHPHHRGIFWAWPEVYYGSEMGDIYALQKLFARPTGNIELISGPVFAEIKAENMWMWEDKEPIVNEKVTIRVYRSSEEIRVIDLKLQFLALKDSITIATRYTDSYGGLNIRMQYPQNQNISYFTDVRNSNPVRAWSDFSGIFEGANKQTGLMVLQNKNNPEYPGDWVEYPDLAWVQPTFPSMGTRYPLSKQDPLIIQYRLLVHTGGEPEKADAIKKWDAYHHNLTPLLSLD